MTGRIIKSVKQEQEEGGCSSLLIHLSKQYCFDWMSKLIRLSYLTLDYARHASIQFGIKTDDYGYPVKVADVIFEQGEFKEKSKADRSIERNG